MTRLRCDITEDGRRCQSPPDRHALARVDGKVWHGKVWPLFFCGPHVLAAAILGCPNGQIVEEHGIDVGCRHPDGQWVNDGCVVPTVDTTVAHIVRKDQA